MVNVSYIDIAVQQNHDIDVGFIVMYTKDEQHFTGMWILPLKFANSCFFQSFYIYMFVIFRELSYRIYTHGDAL